jgi:hypothetical protein
MPIKQITPDEFKEKFTNFYGGNFSLDKTEYTKSNNKIKITCLAHGDFKIYPFKLFKSNLSPCNKCRKEVIGVRATDIKSFITKANFVYNNKYDYSKSIYVSNSSPLIITCREHGDFIATPDSHLSNLKGCPKCKKRHSLTKEEVLNRFKIKHKNKYTYPDFEYKTVYEYINIECPTHGIFKQKIKLHLRGHGCQQCAKDNLKHTLPEFIEKASFIHNNKYDYSSTVYKHSQEKINIICPKHGLFSQIARDHLQGWGCWQCAIESREYSSSYESEIIDFIKAKKPNINIIPRYTINKKELDIYIPELNLGIEFNGTYWHSHLNKDKDYHKNKSDFFKENGIQVFHIWEYEWKDPIKNNVIKSMILNKIKANTNKIYARKCEIKEIQTGDFKNFCLYNHIQGYSPSIVKLGLYHNDILVAVMGLGKLRRNMGNKNIKEDEWELIRYCSLTNNNIIGGASKLLSYFEKTYKPKVIISYSNNDYSNGNMYKILGFIDQKSVNISYNYYDPKTSKIHNRYNFRKSELIKLGFDINLTENEITNKMGLYKIYNSGTSKYTKQI